jgi:hypothetical protein
MSHTRLLLVFVLNTDRTESCDVCTYVTHSFIFDRKFIRAIEPRNVDCS